MECFLHAQPNSIPAFHIIHLMIARILCNEKIVQDPRMRRRDASFLFFDRRAKRSPKPPTLQSNLKPKRSTPALKRMLNAYGTNYIYRSFNQNRTHKAINRPCHLSPHIYQARVGGATPQQTKSAGNSQQ